MDDIATLQKTKEWLIKKHDNIPLEWWAESLQYQVNVGKRHFLFDIILELEEKIKNTEVKNPITLVSDTRNEKRYHCSTCGVEHSIYRIYFSTMQLHILQKVYAYCVENKTHIIEKSKIPGLTHTDYGNFYTLRRFGFLYWLEDDGKKVKGGHWGVAVSRIHDFLRGNWAVAEYSEKNTASQHMENSQNRILISEIPRYKTLTDDQDSFMPYFVEYQNMQEYYQKASDLYTCDNP